jgi:hypothetical protein
MVQVVSHLLLTTEYLIRSQASPCEIYGGQRGNRKRNCVFHVSIISPVLDSHHLYVAVTEGNRDET